MRDYERKRFGRGRRFSGGRSRGFGNRSRNFREGGRKFGERRYSRFEVAPVKVGEKYEVEINDIGQKGDGITKVKNFVIFVPNTKKGDKVKIRIKEVRGRVAFGEVVKEETLEEIPKVTEEGLSEEVATEEYSEEEEEGEAY